MKKQAKKVFEPIIKELYHLVGNFIFGENETSLEQVIGELLKQTNATLATAESCTGGTISQLMTSLAGSSAFFNGGIVSYSNKVKINSLNVARNTLENHGAVSEETVREMAKNVRDLLHSTYGIAVSGVAGPSGGTEEKPIGTVWIAFASAKKTVTKKLLLTPHRDKNIRLSSVYALELLRQNLLLEIAEKGVLN